MWMTILLPPSATVIFKTSSFFWLHMLKLHAASVYKWMLICEVLCTHYATHEYYRHAFSMVRDKLKIIHEAEEMWNCTAGRKSDVSESCINSQQWGK
jgi:hypothetical protein